MEPLVLCVPWEEGHTGGTCDIIIRMMGWLDPSYIFSWRRKWHNFPLKKPTLH